MNASDTSKNSEREVHVFSGWGMLTMVILLLLCSIAAIISSIVPATRAGENPILWLLVAGIIGVVLFVILLNGFFTLQPNEARVLILFGAYKGTVRASGFHWGNPFYTNGPSAKPTRRIGRAHEGSRKWKAAAGTTVSGRNKYRCAPAMNSKKLR